MAKSNGSSKRRKPDSLIRYLPCRAEPGMFNGEYLVYLQGYDRRNPDVPIEIQMWVDQNEVVGLQEEPVRRHPLPAWVQVSYGGKEKGMSLVVLPQPGQPVGERMLVQPKELKREAGG